MQRAARQQFPLIPPILRHRADDPSRERIFPAGHVRHRDAGAARAKGGREAVQGGEGVAVAGVESAGRRAAALADEDEEVREFAAALGDVRLEGGQGAGGRLLAGEGTLFDALEGGDEESGGGGEHDVWVGGRGTGGGGEGFVGVAFDQFGGWVEGLNLADQVAAAGEEGGGYDEGLWWKVAGNW